MSQESNNTELLRDWFRTCPAILKSNYFRVDYLPETATEYALYAVPSTLKSHENILGDEIIDDIQTQNYIFASKEPYGADIQQNLENLGFYQEVTAWIMEQNANRNFPEMSGGVVKSIVPTLTPYMVQAGSNVAKYQIQIKITYRRI